MKSYALIIMLVCSFSIAARATPFNNFSGQYEATAVQCSDSYHPNEVLSLSTLSTIVISETSSANEVKIELLGREYSHAFIYAEFGMFNSKFFGDGKSSAGWSQEVPLSGYLYKIAIHKKNSQYSFSINKSYKDPNEYIDQDVKCLFELRKL